MDSEMLLPNAIWPVMLTDTTGTIRRANPAAEKFIGRPVEGGTLSLADF